MTLAAELEYDGGSPGGDGNLTEQSAWVDAGVERVTKLTAAISRELGASS